MPDFDVGQATSRTAQGAGLGFQLGGPPGALIGGGIGLVSSFFSDDDNNTTPARSRAIRENRELMRMLQERFNVIRNRSPVESTFFRAARRQARQQNERQRERDEATAAARGLEGSQFEIAQAQNRARELGEQQTQALGTAATRQQQRERQALRSLLNQRGSLDQLLSGRAQLQARREQQQNQLAGQAIRGLSATLARSEGDPPLEEPIRDAASSIRDFFT